MSPEAERAAEAHEWLAKVSLEALLVWHDTPFRRTHSLEEIGRVCTSIDSSLNDIVDEAVPLTEYAWAFRYPGAPPTPERHEAEHALDVAGRVVRADELRDE